MRRFLGIPAEYSSYIEGVIARAVDDCRNDHWRRRRGLPPKLPDWYLDDLKTAQPEIGVIACCPSESSIMEEASHYPTEPFPRV